MKKIVSIISVLVNIVTFSMAQPGSLDNTFGTAGKVITDFGVTTSARGYAVAIQSDGKILMAGESATGGVGTLTDFMLVRHNTNGTLDNTFGTNGKVTTDFLNINGQSLSNAGKAMVLQSDGKIVVAGTIGDNSTNPTSYSYGIVRYNTNGTLDNSFGTNGKVYSYEGYCQSLAVQNDGKILITGYSALGDYRFIVSRWNADGSVDQSFGTGLNIGTVSYMVGPYFGTNYSYSIPHAIISQNDGKILVIGYYYYNPTGGTHRFAILRLNTDGSGDASFGNGGLVYGDLTDPDLNIGTYLDNAYCATLQSDGKILVGGMTSSSLSVSDWALVRLNTDGSMDNTFGTNGVAIANILPAGNEDPRSIAVQSDGKIVVAGSTGNNAGRDIALVRFNSNGSLDNTFDGDGKVITPVGSGEDWGYSVALQSDGKIVVGGLTIGTKSDFVLLRYNGGGGVSGVNEIEKVSEVIIYPNPSSEIITIEIENINLNSNYVILNSIGQQVLSGQLKDKTNTIDISGLSAGIYLIQVGEKEKQTFKLIKE